MSQVGACQKNKATVANKHIPYTKPFPYSGWSASPLLRTQSNKPGTKWRSTPGVKEEKLNPVNRPAQKSEPEQAAKWASS